MFVAESMFKEVSEVAQGYAEKLVKGHPHNAGDEVPKEIGVYLWRSKKDPKDIVYVGRALGKNGLHQRIYGNHLSASYKKSVFKRSVAKEYPREEPVSFIKKNYAFSYISFDRKDKRIVPLVEALLICELSPKYNHEGK